MADPKSTVPDVNLIPGDDLEGRPGGIFLKWALTWGKRIVVTTELIVILAFLSRFWLDTEVANNSEKINQKKIIVLSESEFENKFRSLFDRVVKSQAIEKITSPLTVYDQAEKLILPTVTVSQISVTNHSVSFTASTDEASLGKVVTAFKNSPYFTDVSVDRVAQKIAGPGVDFSLKATYVETNPEA